MKKYLVSLVLIALAPFAVFAADLPKAAPAEAGLSAEKLAEMNAHFQAYVDDGRLAGLTTLVARKGQVVDFQTYGALDTESGQPMREDAIFRIYSMTKPITGVALMMLYEEGKFALDDPVSKYIPGFADARVFKSEAEDGTLVTEPAARDITVRDLMRHTSGLTYGVFGNTPVDKSYLKSQLIGVDQPMAEWVPRLAEQPLLYQPGAAWVYSLSVEVQGYLVEVLSGQPFDEFLQERIFDPLGMTDTGFYVPGDKLDRFVGIYELDENKKLVASKNKLLQDFSLNPQFKSGGGGLVSTTADYWRFAQMVANGGTLDGVTILKPETIAMMSTNQLPEALPGIAGGKRGLGFGLDFAVVLDPAKFGNTGEAGEYFWGGMANTVFWIDPTHDIVAILMTNILPNGIYELRNEMRTYVNDAIAD